MSDNKHAESLYTIATHGTMRSKVSGKHDYGRRVSKSITVAAIQHKFDPWTFIGVTGAQAGDNTPLWFLLVSRWSNPKPQTCLNKAMISRALGTVHSMWAGHPVHQSMEQSRYGVHPHGFVLISLLVMTRSNSQHTVRRRKPLLFALPMPYLPIMSSQMMWLVPTPALKSLSGMSLSCRGLSKELNEISHKS